MFCELDIVKKCYVCPTCAWEEPLEETLKVSRGNSKNVEKIVVVGKKERKLSTMP